jgi:hypothetical protein
MSKAKELISILNGMSESELDNPMKEYEYLLHHVETDEKGNENLHHCFVYDHIGNLFSQSHITVKDGKIYDENGKQLQDGVYHVISGLEPNQDVTWSDEQAREKGITPKRMVAGMSFKQKGKEW